jgi:hypothetical protein
MTRKPRVAAALFAAAMVIGSIAAPVLADDAPAQGEQQAPKKKHSKAKGAIVGGAGGAVVGGKKGAAVGAAGGALVQHHKNKKEAKKQAKAQQQ